MVSSWPVLAMWLVFANRMRWKWHIISFNLRPSDPLCVLLVLPLPRPWEEPCLSVLPLYQRELMWCQSNPPHLRPAEGSRAFLSVKAWGRAVLADGPADQSGSIHTVACHWDCVLVCFISGASWYNIFPIPSWYFFSEFSWRKSLNVWNNFSSNFLSLYEVSTPRISTF